jgi:hypothetical protein
MADDFWNVVERMMRPATPPKDERASVRFMAEAILTSQATTLTSGTVLRARGHEYRVMEVLGSFAERRAIVRLEGRPGAPCFDYVAVP